MNAKAMCLICSENIATLRESNIARHYNSKHNEKYKTYLGAMRRKKVVALKTGLESQQNVFRKQSNDSLCVL
jgi:hypothetical protein